MNVNDKLFNILKKYNINIDGLSFFEIEKCLDKIIKFNNDTILNRKRELQILQNESQH